MIPSQHVRNGMPHGVLPLEPAPAPMWARYALAFAASLTALALTLDVPSLANGAPLSLFFGAVALSAWYGGVGPGLVATGLSALLASYFFVPPIYAFGPLAADDALRLAGFIAVGALICGLSGSLHAMRQRAEASATEATALARQLEEQAIELEHQMEESQALTVHLGEQQLELEQQVEEAQALTAQLEEQQEELEHQMYEVEAARAEAERRAAVLATVFESMPDAVYVGTAEGITLANALALEQLGVSSLGELNARFATVTEELCIRHADTGERLRSGEGPFSRALGGERAVDELLVRHRLTGEDRVLRASAAPIRAGGALVGAVCVNTDTTERKRAEEQLRATQTRLKHLITASPAVIYSVRVRGDVITPTWVSANIARVMGYSAEEALQPNWWPNHLHPEDQARLLTGDATYLTRPESTLEYRFRHRDGSYHWIRDDMRQLPAADGDGVEIIGAWIDITERKELEAQLTYQAFHDPLTGLANRTLFRDRVEHAVARAGRGERVAVLFLDVDDFKTINDSLGHAAGDQLLVTVSERLLRATRGCDTVVRLGGDEFAVLLEAMAQEKDALTVVERITTAMARPIVVQGREVLVGVSIGVAHVRPGEGVDELLRNADLAMYRAKGAGKGRHEVFEPAMHAAVLDRLELEADLRSAVDHDEFRLLYQPIVELASGRVTGVEALVRWQHPERGLIPPAGFIPLAEETGLIVPLGRWVLLEACRQLKYWQLCVPSASAASLSVNISGRQLQDPALVDTVAAVLAETQVEPHCLVLEITESVIMQRTEATLQQLYALKALGLRLAIDDFGTGYSSLSYLQRFPVDILKIDKAFIDGVARGGSDAVLARTIIALGDTLGLRTVAEGVEHAEQRSQLLLLGCALGQGNLFGQPLAAADVEALLTGGRLLDRVGAAA